VSIRNKSYKIELIAHNNKYISGTMLHHPNHYIINLVTDTVELFADTVPKIIKIDSGICAYWPLNLDDDTIAEPKLKTYFEYLKDIFENEFQRLKMRITYSLQKIKNSDEIYSCVFLEYQSIINHRDAISYS